MIFNKKNKNTALVHPSASYDGRYCGKIDKYPDRSKQSCDYHHEKMYRLKHTNQRENTEQKKRVFFEADIYRNTRNIIDRSHENFGSNHRENGDKDQEEFS